MFLVIGVVASGMVLLDFVFELRLNRSISVASVFALVE
jgi:hypothetical protein